MTTTHFRDQTGRPIGTKEADDPSEISAAVINDTFERQYIVEIGDDGSTHCTTCDDCDHAEQVSNILETDL